MVSLIEIYSNLASYQYLILFLLVLFEGPIVTIAAGFLVAQGYMALYIALPIIIIADLVGDVFYYYLGRSGRQFGLRLLGKKRFKLAALEEHFEENAGKTILFGKIAHGVGALFLFAAGAAHVKMSKFLFYNTIGTIPKSIIMLLVGYFFGHSYVRIAKFFDIFGFASLGIGLIILGLYLVFAKKIRKKEDL